MHLSTQRLEVFCPKVGEGVAEHFCTHVLFACASPYNPVSVQLQEYVHNLPAIYPNIGGFEGQIVTQALLEKSAKPVKQLVLHYFVLFSAS